MINILDDKDYIIVLHVLMMQNGDDMHFKGVIVPNFVVSMDFDLCQYAMNY